MTKKTSYRLTSDAQNDLIDIRRFTLKQWGEKQSLKYLSEIRQMLRILSERPSIGKRHREVADDVFSFPYVSHVVYYTLNKSQLVVFAVLHKSMVPHHHLENRSTG